MIAANERHAEMIEAVKEACGCVDMSGNLMYVNEAFCAMLGYEREELLAKTYQELTPTKWHDKEAEIVKNQVTARGFSEIYEKEYVRKDGSTFPVELMTTLVKDDAGIPTGMMAIVRDITGRVQMQQELLRSREEYRTLTENSPDIVIRFDRDLRHIYANSAAGRACGLSIEDLVGKTLFEIGLEQSSSDVWRQRISSVFQTGIPAKVEDTMPFPSGIRNFEYQLVPEGNQSGMPASVMVIGREITERKRAEEDLFRAQQELERRVVERTLSLQKALQEQESFSYSVSHDLRAPLRHINGYLTILQEEFGDLLPSEAQKLIERSREGSQHMGKLIDDLLELARIVRATLAKQEVDLSELAAHAGEVLQDSEPTRQVHFAIQGGLIVQGDRLLLKQMMDNLVQNAWKYSAFEPAALIRFGRESADGRDIFYVSDNGVGFDMEFSDQLFRAFQRLHGPEYPGNGIGLATVKRIVDRHGGRIWAESKVGLGATFYFTLP